MQGIIVELPLAPFFLKQLLRRGVDVNDLPTLDAEHYRNLMFLRSYEGDVEELSLTFTITQDVYGEIREVSCCFPSLERLEARLKVHMSRSITGLEHTYCVSAQASPALRRVDQPDQNDTS